MSVAQAMYRAMLRDQIAPAMRALGLDGSLTKYRLNESNAIGVVSFQSSMGKDRTLKRFTINLYVVRPEEPDPDERSDDWPRWEPRFSERIGKVMPGRRDTWWEIRPITQTDLVATEVIGAIRDSGLPAIRAHHAHPDTGLRAGPTVRW